MRCAIARLPPSRATPALQAGLVNADVKGIKRGCGTEMPTIAQFHGIIIYMYWAEHGVAHLHAIQGEEEAVFSIESGKTLAGAMSRKPKKLVREWIALRRAELMENWRRGRNGLPFERVPGPDQ